MPQYQFQDREGVQIVPAGDYLLGVESAKLCLSKSTGDEQIEMQIRILTEKGTAGLVYHYPGFSEKRAWTLDVCLKALRKAPKKGETLDISDAWLIANIVGQLGWGTIGVEKDNKGVDRNILVRWIAHPDAAKLARIAAEEKRLADAQASEAQPTAPETGWDIPDTNIPI